MFCWMLVDKPDVRIVTNERSKRMFVPLDMSNMSKEKPLQPLKPRKEDLSSQQHRLG